MSSQAPDPALLWDMHQAASEISDFMKGVTYVDFCTKKMLRYAVERQIIVIGEAAKQVANSYKTDHPEIPWRSIISQRNVLAHEYGEIVIERVWVTATKSVPDLLAILGRLIPQLPKTDT